jgi:hypothetical protein
MLRARRNTSRHPRESGEPVRRGFSVDHQRFWNTGSPGQAGRRRLMSRRVPRRRGERRNDGGNARLFLIPPPAKRCVVELAASSPSSREAVGRVAHRERSERCVGWGCFREFPMSTAIALNRPPPRPPADPPHASRGRDKKERAATRPCSLVGGVRSLRAIVPHLQQSRDNRSRSPKLALRLIRSNEAGKFSRG